MYGDKYISDFSKDKNVHLKKIKVDKLRTRDDYATKISTLTPGFSGADIANVYYEAAIIAARNDLKQQI